MKGRRTFRRLATLIPLAICFALVGTALADGGFYNKDFRGRYTAAGFGKDISSVHNASNGNIGPAIDFTVATVILSDGQGNVCGEVDGQYALGTSGAIPANNLGPQFFHGTYKVDINGRITIDTCVDAGPFCTSPTPICSGTTGTCTDPSTGCADAANNHETQVGYLQGYGPSQQVTTTTQTNSSFSSGFLLSPLTWERSLF